jgi:hypothetical protein
MEAQFPIDRGFIGRVKSFKIPTRTSNLAKSILWHEQRNDVAGVPPVTGETRIESEDAAIGMKFTQSHQIGVR